MNAVAVAKHRSSLSESDQSAYQETSAVTYYFDHPKENYVNFLSTDLPTQMIKTVVDRVVDSDLGYSFKYMFQH